MTFEEMIVVLQAAKEGKKIQRKLRPLDGCVDDHKWETVYLGEPLFGVYDYRVKPEPIEIWAFVQRGHTVHYAYNSEQEFYKANYASHPLEGPKPKLFREVI